MIWSPNLIRHCSLSHLHYDRLRASSKTRDVWCLGGRLVCIWRWDETRHVCLSPRLESLFVLVGSTAGSLCQWRKQSNVNGPAICLLLNCLRLSMSSGCMFDVKYILCFGITFAKHASLFLLFLRKKCMSKCIMPLWAVNLMVGAMLVIWVYISSFPFA